MSDCFGNGFLQRLGKHQIRQNTKASHKPHNPRAGAKVYIRGELNASMVLGAFREKEWSVQARVRWADGR